MNPAALAATRYFPLIGRPRPACPPLPQRVEEIAAIARAARQDGADGLAEGAHALNKAALLASDCGLPSLARDLCWQHINIYRAAQHPLTVLQARYMLEPVLNLARLRIRASDSEQALQLLTLMYDAITSHTDLIIDGHTLPLTNLHGTQQKRHKLREWVWLHLVGDGIRTLALAGRWSDAVAHAEAHRGIGLHLLEGRQAKILHHLLDGAPAAARAALAESTPEHPWEHQVATCLTVMCAEETPPRQRITNMIEEFRGHDPAPGYAVFRAQLGMTMTTLATTTDPDAANALLSQVIDEVRTAGDGHAARQVLAYLTGTPGGPRDAQRDALANLLHASGLGADTPPEHLPDALLRSARIAEAAVAAAIELTEIREELSSR
jgi:hypothetical protein